MNYENTLAKIILDHLYAKGCHLSDQGSKLVLEAPKGTITPQLDAAIQRHKPAIIKLIKQDPYNPEVSKQLIESSKLQEPAHSHQIDLCDCENCGFNLWQLGHLKEGCEECNAYKGNLIFRCLNCGIVAKLNLRKK